MKIIPTGSIVYAFKDELKAEPELFESKILGHFFHKNEGELYYFLENDQYPAYCVGETEEEANELLNKFNTYRQNLLAANEETSKAYKALRSEFMSEEFTVDAISALQDARRAAKKAEAEAEEEVK